MGSASMSSLLRGLLIMASLLALVRLNSSAPVTRDIRRIYHSSSLEKPTDLLIRVRRRTHDTGFSVVEQFEVLRKRYLESLRARPTSRGSSIRDRVQQNQNFLESIG